MVKTESLSGAVQALVVLLSVVKDHRPLLDTESEEVLLVQWRCRMWKVTEVESVIVEMNCLVS